MNPKPIVVIYLPENFSIDGGREDAPMELMRALNNNFGHGETSNGRKYPDYWTEYYWLCFQKPYIDAPEFQVFHPKDFTEIEFNELKDKVLADLEEMKTNKTKQS